MPTPYEVAQWMSHEFDRSQYLEQRHAANAIQERFGAEHVYTNRHGNLAIAKPVLREFETLRPDLAFVNPRYWRKKAVYDAPSRRQRPLTEAEYKAKTGKRQL